MNFETKAFLTLAVGLALGGCTSFGGSNPSPPVAAPVVGTAVAAPPEATPITGALAGPLGADLDEADRRKAFDAQVAALESGQRKSWKGGKGMFGFVEPGPEGARAEGSCRDVALTVYVAGRPRTAKGIGCKDAGGAWRVRS